MNYARLVSDTHGRNSLRPYKRLPIWYYEVQECYVA